MTDSKIQCKLCDGEAVKIHNGTRDNPNVDVYLCGKCETRFLIDNSPLDYENGFMNGNLSMSDDEIKKRLESCKMDDIRRGRMMRERVTGKSILDFGCGFGGYLSYIREFADECAGVELSSDERKYVNSCGIPCFKSLDECDKKYDLVTMFHVLEHLENPVEWLQKIRTVMKEGASLFIEVPHVNDVLLKLYENEKFADFTYWSAHLYLYSDISLTEVIKKSNCYDIIDRGQIQRYPISNTLMWLAKGKPGGHKLWNFLDSDDINSAYVNRLKELGMCDTLFYELKAR